MTRQKIQLVVLSLGVFPTKQLFCPELCLVNDLQWKQGCQTGQVKDPAERNTVIFLAWGPHSRRHTHAVRASLLLGGFTFPLETSLTAQSQTLSAPGLISRCLIISCTMNTVRMCFQFLKWPLHLKNTGEKRHCNLGWNLDSYNILHVFYVLGPISLVFSVYMW